MSSSLARLPDTTIGNELCETCERPRNVGMVNDILDANGHDVEELARSMPVRVCKRIIENLLKRAVFQAANGKFLPKDRSWHDGNGNYNRNC